MKTNKTIFGIIAVFVIMALSFLACDNANAPLPNSFTVTFNADNGTENITQSVIEGNMANKPTDPVRDGYKFIHWANEATDEEWDFETPIIADINLRAKWDLARLVIADDFRMTFINAVFRDGININHSGFIIVLGEDSIIISGDRLASPVIITGVYSAGGGEWTSGLFAPGSWTYLYQSGKKIGFIMNHPFEESTYYLLMVGFDAKHGQPQLESAFNIIMDLTGVNDYPSFMAEKMR